MRGWVVFRRDRSFGVLNRNERPPGARAVRARVAGRPLLRHPGNRAAVIRDLHGMGYSYVGAGPACGDPGSPLRYGRDDDVDVRSDGDDRAGSRGPTW